jgi:paraquat-inducible protein A
MSQALPLSACYHCDQLLTMPPAGRHQQLICPRCHSPLGSFHNADLSRPLAFAVTGLVLAVPANTLPIMTLSLLGQANANTMIGGVAALWHNGFWWMAFLVLLCSVAAPVALLLNVATVCSLMQLRLGRAAVAPHLRLYQRLAVWAMADVYMLGILVAYIKMLDMGDLHIGAGLWSFAGMLLMTVLTRYYFDPHALWRQLT